MEDPQHLLEGTGKFMRHVKLKPGQEIDSTALKMLVVTAYTGIRHRLESGPHCSFKADASGAA
jgi:hypothetical protein